jgi:hypothetical protein
MHKGTEKGEEELRFHGCEVEVCSALEFFDDFSPRINIVRLWIFLFLPTKQEQGTAVDQERLNLYSGTWDRKSLGIDVCHI